jgi:nitrite reductase/ring-hydroxylating ferredoxin subunit
MQDTNEWTAVAVMRDIEKSGTLQVRVAGEPVCLYRLGNEVYATQDMCTHGVASLADGYVDGDKIECPLHQGLFHIPTGKAVGVPCTEHLRVYPVKLEGESVFIGPCAQVLA